MIWVAAIAYVLSVTALAAIVIVVGLEIFRDDVPLRWVLAPTAVSVLVVLVAGSTLRSSAELASPHLYWWPCLIGTGIGFMVSRSLRSVDKRDFRSTTQRW